MVQETSLLSTPYGYTTIEMASILTEEQSKVNHFYRKKFGLEKSDLD
jgi:hypothetical protein